MINYFVVSKDYQRWRLSGGEVGNVSLSVYNEKLLLNTESFKVILNSSPLCHLSESPLMKDTVETSPLGVCKWIAVAAMEMCLL